MEFPFGFPLPWENRANRYTLPSVNVTVGTENVTIEIPNHAFLNKSYVGSFFLIPNHAFLNKSYVGSFFLDLRTAIPAGTTATLPVLIGTNGDTRPLLEYGTTPATVANFAGPGIYEIHYNRYTNQLYMVNGGFRPSAETAPTA